MAMHLVRVTTAVASCGTAFGEHSAMLRRLMMNDSFRGELITFSTATRPVSAAAPGLRRQKLAGQSSVAFLTAGPLRPTTEVR